MFNCVYLGFLFTFLIPYIQGIALARKWIEPILTRLLKSFNLKLIGACSLLLLGLFLVFPQSAWGANPQIERQNLTLELLQERLNNSEQEPGIPAINLRQLIIDLRAETGQNSSGTELTSEKFYQLLQAELTQRKVGLDLSQSVILGNFEINKLGLRSPLYGESLSPLFNETELTQLQRDRRRLSQLSLLSRSLLLNTSRSVPSQITVFRGPLILRQTHFKGETHFSSTFFLDRVDAQAASFEGFSDWSSTRFSQLANFVSSIFNQQASFKAAIFFDKARFTDAQFQADVVFTNSNFVTVASFNQANFNQIADFKRVKFQANADFSQARWQQQALFNQTNFIASCFLTEASFEQLVTFREAQFSQPVNLRGASILEQADFSDVTFSKNAYLNVSSLEFDAERAKISGSPGEIGQRLSVPTLQGNESLLRNLVRNFREVEQIADANQIEYLREKLRLQQLARELLGINLNTASIQRLEQLGLNSTQAQAIASRREEQLFQTLNDLLALDEIDLASYIKVRDKAIAIAPRTLGLWVRDSLHWTGLSLLLLLSRYGTSFWLTFGVGLVALAFFGLIFWLIDRFRRLVPQPIIPTRSETIWALACFGAISLCGAIAIFRAAESPGLTLLCLAVAIAPFPTLLVFLLYQRGRYHNLMDVSYFVEDGSMRQLRLLIGRMPVIPRFTFFRDRHLPLLTDRRWNFLNYYDFSLNNWFRFGFNDIRLRDEQVPGLIAALAWYQWSLGLLYTTLILWTLSRTIPGLNLLIYFK